MLMKTNRRFEDVQQKAMTHAAMIDTVIKGLDDLDGKADYLGNQSLRNNI